jgi:hypothetical protein
MNVPLLPSCDKCLTIFGLIYFYIKLPIAHSFLHQFDLFNSSCENMMLAHDQTNIWFDLLVFIFMYLTISPLVFTKSTQRQIHMIKQLFTYIWSCLFFIKMPISCSSYHKLYSFNWRCTNMRPAHQTNIWLYLTLFVLTSNCP